MLKTKAWEPSPLSRLSISYFRLYLSGCPARVLSYLDCACLCCPARVLSYLDFVCLCCPAWVLPTLDLACLCCPAWVLPSLDCACLCCPAWVIPSLDFFYLCWTQSAACCEFPSCLWQLLDWISFIFLNKWWLHFSYIICSLSFLFSTWFLHLFFIAWKFSVRDINLACILGDFCYIIM